MPLLNVFQELTDQIKLLKLEKELGGKLGTDLGDQNGCKLNRFVYLVPAHFLLFSFGFFTQELALKVWWRLLNIYRGEWV